MRCTMKRIHFNGLRRTRAVRCSANQSAREAERTSGELARAPQSNFKIVKLLPLRSVTFPRAANGNRGRFSGPVSNGTLNPCGLPLSLHVRDVMPL